MRESHGAKSEQFTFRARFIARPPSERAASCCDSRRTAGRTDRNIISGARAHWRDGASSQWPPAPSPGHAGRIACLCGMRELPPLCRDSRMMMRRLFVATLAIPPCPTRHGGSLPKMRDEAHHCYVVYVHFCTTARRVLVAPFLCVNGGHPLLVLDLTHTTQLILCDRMNEGRDEGASQDPERVQRDLFS